MPTSGCKLQVTTIQKAPAPQLRAPVQRKPTFGELAEKSAGGVSTNSTGKIYCFLWLTLPLLAHASDPYPVSSSQLPCCAGDRRSASSQCASCKRLARARAMAHPHQLPANGNASPALTLQSSDSPELSLLNLQLKYSGKSTTAEHKLNWVK